MNHQLFQVMADELGRTKGQGFAVKDKLLLVRVIQSSAECVSGLHDDLGQELFFRILDDMS